jgi:phosphoribosylamine--glycine ligase
MEAASIPCIGPSRAAAQLEGSKAFTKELCDAVGIPTAQWERFDDAEAAREFVRRRGAPIVVKADGLAAGKAVVVAATEAEALAAIDAMMQTRAFGEAGAAVVIEECLVGEEVSLFALCDGETALPLGAAQDHKRVGEGETGPNTGGMGAYSPTPSFSTGAAGGGDGSHHPSRARRDARRGTPFRGILCRRTDAHGRGREADRVQRPVRRSECQALLPRLMSDLLPALHAAYDGELENFDLRWTDAASIAVVMAARGYPDAPERGSEIRGLDRAAAVPNVRIFHAGTEADGDGRIRAAGGRALNVCATGADLRAARDGAYAAMPVD